MAEQSSERQLVTVAQYVKMKGIKAAQIVHGMIRNQGAPYVEHEGKRMIDVDEFDAWMKEKEQKRASGQGTTRAQSIQKKTKIREGTLMAYTTGVDNRLAVAKADKIGEYVLWTETSSNKKRGREFQIPFGWESLANKLKSKDLILANPHIVIDLLISHYESDDPDKHAQELDLLQQLKLLADPTESPDVEIVVPETTVETDEESEETGEE